MQQNPGAARVSRSAAPAADPVKGRAGFDEAPSVGGRPWPPLGSTGYEIWGLVESGA